MSYIPELFESKDYATAIKVLDSMAGELHGPALASLLCNRALCYQKMDLHRKALHNYEEALKAHPTFARAHMGRGKALQALGRPKEAQAAWNLAIEGFSAADDLQLTEDAFRFIHDPESCNGKAKQVQAPPAPAPSVAAPIAQKAVQNGNASNAVVQRPQQPQSGAKGKQSMENPSISVAIAVGQINNGRIDDALRLLDEVIGSSSEPNMGALVARGTAKAMRRDLTGAIDDFSGAIKVYPSYGDVWKRRGQARSAHGDREGALGDFKRALELIKDNRGRAEMRLEVAMIYQKDRDLRQATKELEISVKLDDKNATAWTHLGLCLTGQGDIEESVEAYRRALALDPKNVEALFNLAQVRKEAAHAVEAEEAFKNLFQVAKASQKSSHSQKVYAHMKQGLGEHIDAIKVLNDALEHAEAGTKVECHFLRGACYHALGYYRQAIEDYSKAFVIHDEGLAEDVRQQQVLAFFQRELVMYSYNRLDDDVASFSLDRDIHPVFKELWAKKMPPNQAQLLVCRKEYDKIPGAEPSKPPPLPDKAESARLVKAADNLGRLLQNHHQGFLPNKRQQRMGGLAAIELAQAVRHLLELRRQGREVTVDQGATGDPSTHSFGWRDAMDIVVKWRQLSEPNDPVIWVDLLTEKEFGMGFGSHTPIFSGQTKCVRYYMNFHRALALFKEIILKEGKAFNANSQPVPLGSDAKKEAIQAAQTAEEMWNAVGEDSWIVVPIQSLLHPGETLEGTRLTIVKFQDQPDAYEMSIRTPVTPHRWKQFDAELTALWEQLLETLSTGTKPQMAKAILTYVYYWYNFMPLARGTAASGYVTLLSLFLAANMPVTASIPKNYQVDWEAILQCSPGEFLTSLSGWLLPEEAKERGADDSRAACQAQPTCNGQTPPIADSAPPASGEQVDQPGWQFQNGACLDGPGSAEADRGGPLGILPSVSRLIPTLRNRLEVLNGPGLPRL